MTLAVNIAQSGANNVTMRNRIINGAMVISQRGTSFSGNPSGYTLDRWNLSIPTPSSVTTTQSTDAPAGFVNSLLITVTTGGTISSSANYFAQYIEGNNVADFGFGTSSASSVTISFWVKSSVTGTFGGSLRNFTTAPATTFRAYPFTYTINSANTWEQKSVTIAGDGVAGAGQWNTGTQGSFAVFFDLGSGSLTGTANAWASSNLIGVTGTQTTLMTGSGNTWRVTGVQLERGTAATAFEQRLYGTELALCQRYYEIYTSGSSWADVSIPYNGATNNQWLTWRFQVTKRATVSLVNASATTISSYSSITATNLTTYGVNWNGNAAFYIASYTGPSYLGASAEL